MSKPIIEVSHLSKEYQLGAIGATSLKEECARLWRTMLGLEKKQNARAFWALDDVSFNVQPGEVIGVIGRNGAGKSTLLKILSHITQQTKGRIVLRGRVASLLEVGTGFHPDLTGRENTYLNGAILGMTKAEIRKKFDEIVAFAEVEQFVDTPVKRYSSGMYVRLAFAVAAHLEPEILIVDEVLAVGDAAFQKKCLGKMSEVSTQQGRTVLFVSHNTGAISSLTHKTLYLQSGKMAGFGHTPAVVQHYLSDSFSHAPSWEPRQRTKHPLQITRLQMLDGNGASGTEFEASDGFTIEIMYEVRERLRGAIVEVYIFSIDGTHLVTLGDHDCDRSVLEGREPGIYTCHIAIPGNWLNIGKYFIRINSALTTHKTFDNEDTLSFDLVEARETTARYNRRGCLVPLLPWSVVSRVPLS